MRPVFVLSRSVHRVRHSFPRAGSTRLRISPIRRMAGPFAGAGLAAGLTVTAVLAAGASGDGSAHPIADAGHAAEAVVPATAGPAIDGSAAQGPTGDAAGEPFRAGEQGVAEAPLPAAAAAARADLAARTGVILGLPAASRRSATRVTDRFGGGTYDEVTEFDARDRLVSLQRFDTGGRLLAAVRFGWTGDGGPALAGPAEARRRAERLAASLGLVPTGTPRVAAAPSNAGWSVAWTREVAGVPVPGDGLRIQLWPDGSIHGVARSERGLAPRPAVVIDALHARSLAEAQLDAWFRGDVRAQVAIEGLALAWVSPNDAFGTTGTDAPGSVLRLAWVVRITASSPLSDSLRGLELDLDAGTGGLIGGDVLE